MARVTEAEVEEIFENEEDLTLTPFITAANLLVTRTLGNKNLTPSELKEIERWLSAHFAVIRQRQAKSEKIGDASVTYEGEHAMELRHTSYGQQALILDPTGTLAKLGRPGAKFAVISQNELPD